VLRAVTDRYGKQVGIDLTPDHEALNPAVAISFVASTGGVGLLPLYVRNMLPPHFDQPAPQRRATPD